MCVYGGRYLLAVAAAPDAFVAAIRAPLLIQRMKWWMRTIQKKKIREKERLIAHSFLCTGRSCSYKTHNPHTHSQTLHSHTHIHREIDR